MNEQMIKIMKATDTNSAYENLKNKEKELLAQLHELKEEIANAEKDIIVEKLNTALQCLADVDEMTNSFYRCSIETYCDNCDENVEVYVDLAEIISALQQLR